MHARFVGFGLRAVERLLYAPRLRKAYSDISDGLRESPIIVDVGANDGSSIRFFNRAFGRATVFAFEPDPAVAERLRRRTRGMDVQIATIACSDVDGMRAFSRCVFDEVSTLEELSAGSEYLRRKARVLLTPADLLYEQIEVEVCRLDTWFSGAQDTPFDILKIDVEGHELAVLRGASELLGAQAFRVVQLESHEDDQYTIRHSEIAELLTAAGYSLHARIRHSFGNFYDEIWVSISTGTRM